jgi:7-carboxy-7-deazaguanine synthase
VNASSYLGGPQEKITHAYRVIIANRRTSRSSIKVTANYLLRETPDLAASAGRRNRAPAPFRTPYSAFSAPQFAFSAVSLGNGQTDAMITTTVGMNAETLIINEIYQSVQGESTWAGLPCVFVRLTFCDLRCSYCDTAYAFYKGTKRSLSEIVEQVLGYQCPLVEITGGEPLLQKNVLPLMQELCDHGLTVLIETSGAHDISRIDQRVHRIMDLKTPSSGESHRNRIENMIHLNRADEVKFVIGSREDYLWAKAQIEAFNLAERCGTILFSPVFEKIEPRSIVEWLLADKLPVRFQLQLHKFIWAPETKGV